MQHRRPGISTHHHISSRDIRIIPLSLSTLRTNPNTGTSTKRSDLILPTCSRCIRTGTITPSYRSEVVDRSAERGGGRVPAELLLLLGDGAGMKGVGVANGRIDGKGIVKLNLIGKSTSMSGFPRDVRVRVQSRSGIHLKRVLLLCRWRNILRIRVCYENGRVGCRRREGGVGFGSGGFGWVCAPCTHMRGSGINQGGRVGRVGDLGFGDGWVRVGEDWASSPLLPARSGRLMVNGWDCCKPVSEWRTPADAFAVSLSIWNMISHQTPSQEIPLHSILGVVTKLDRSFPLGAREDPLLLLLRCKL